MSAAACAIVACGESAIVLDDTSPVAYTVNGYVDRGRGVALFIRKTLSPAQEYNLDSLHTFNVRNALVTLCTVDGARCVEIARTTSGLYELPELPTWATGTVSLRVEIEDATYESQGYLPELTGVTYEARSTRYVPQEDNGDQVFGNTYAHDFSFTVADPRLLAFVAIDMADADDAGPVFIRDSPSACGIFSYRTSDRILFPTCPLESEISLRIYQFAERGPGSWTFFLGVTGDPAYFNYLQAIGQDNFNSEFGGLYDVITQPSHSNGIGGYVLFSASRKVDVVH